MKKKWRQWKEESENAFSGWNDQGVWKGLRKDPWKLRFLDFFQITFGVLFVCKWMHDENVLVFFLDTFMCNHNQMSQ
jgi:hypothetical protein